MMLRSWDIGLPIFIVLPWFSKGHYKALGRVINAQYLKERLTLKDSNFDAATRSSMELVKRLTILADVFYIKVNVLQQTNASLSDVLSKHSRNRSILAHPLFKIENKKQRAFMASTLQKNPAALTVDAKTKPSLPSPLR